MNDISATLYYNTRIAISAPIETPITWHCSKVENTSPKGISRLTFAQKAWDDHADAFEYSDGTFSSVYNPNKKVVGIWCDYYSSPVLPMDNDKPKPKTKITWEYIYSAKPQVKVGGGYKKFDLVFYEDNIKINRPDGHFEYYINENDASDLVNTTLDDGILKVKFLGNDSYIGSVLLIKYITDTNIEAPIEVEILGL